MFSFLPNQNDPLNKLLAADPSYCWLYPSKQAVDRFMLFTCLYHVLFSHLECSVKQVLTADLSACSAGAGRLLTTTKMNNLKSPTNARIAARLQTELHTKGCGGQAIIPMSNTEIRPCSNYPILQAQHGLTTMISRLS